MQGVVSKAVDGRNLTVSTGCIALDTISRVRESATAISRWERSQNYNCSLHFQGNNANYTLQNGCRYIKVPREE